ncbi:MAG: type II secretion system F family protein [Actinobacteria bacterium]|nr:type II secretion system F family protein [Actinomycetota bacterium]MCL5883099.1 type II secretion system F family protein [Actinomycetota bacterium]
MSTFVYKVRDVRGVPAKGEVEGESRAAVLADLRNKGYTVVGIDEKSAGTSFSSMLNDARRIKSKNITVFSRQFATMINSGLALLRALYILENQTQNQKLQQVISEIRTDVESGSALSDSLEKHPKVFSRLYVSMVRAGEAGGILDETLNRVASQLEAEDSLRRMVKSAMVYPLLIAAFAVLVMMAMMLFIIPIFSKMYSDMGSQLPLLTRIMVTISDTLRSVWGIFVFAAIFGAIYGLIRLKKTPQGTAAWDRAKLRLPMGIGDIILKLSMARFSRTLSTLVSSGVPILQAIEITGETAGNTVVSKAMANVKREVKEGRPMSEPLTKTSVFPPMVTQMIAVGEETGAVDTMLNKIADFYEDEVNASVKSLTSILEPIMMMGVGGLVGVIVISLYLPIFNLMSVVK